VKLADVQFSDHERVVVARLTGEIDLSNAQSVESAIVEATPNHALALILDVSALDYLDSAGIHLIYKLREKLRARGQALRLVIPADSAANDALRLAGVSRNIDTAETLETAVAAFAADPAEAADPADSAEAAEAAPEMSDVQAPAEVPDAGGA
jgi:anti-sigma B factor antagonist